MKQREKSVDLWFAPERPPLRAVGELDISQRGLAADGIINAGALIAFEKGRGLAP